VALPIRVLRPVAPSGPTLRRRSVGEPDDHSGCPRAKGRLEPGTHDGPTRQPRLLARHLRARLRVVPLLPPLPSRRRAWKPPAAVIKTIPPGADRPPRPIAAAAPPRCWSG
jgi:hypothetical protein